MLELLENVTPNDLYAGLFDASINTHPYRLAMEAYRIEYHLANEHGWTTAGTGPLGIPGRNLLRRIGNNMVARKVLNTKYNDGTLNTHMQAALIPPLTFGEKVAQHALSQQGVHEVPWGSNNGPQVRVYEATTGGYGEPWCASFRSWACRQAGYKGEVSATAWAWDNIGTRISTGHTSIGSAQEGDAVTFQIGTGHIGTYLSHDSSGVKTVDGNTSDEVAVRVRSLSLIRAITRQKG